MQLSNAFLVNFLFAFMSAANGATVYFYNSREATCGGGASLEYRNIGCNQCVDPPNDWWGAQVTGINGDQRVSMHNQDRCTPASQVGQWYGNICARAGNTALRSVWIACSGQRIGFGSANTTEVADEDKVTFFNNDTD